MLGGIEQSPYPRGISPSAVCDVQGRGSARSQARQILPAETIMYQIDRLSHPSHITVESACVLLDIYHVGLDNRQLPIQLHDTAVEPLESLIVPCIESIHVLIDFSHPAVESIHF